MEDLLLKIEIVLLFGISYFSTKIRCVEHKNYLQIIFAGLEKIMKKFVFLRFFKCFFKARFHR